MKPIHTFRNLRYFIFLLILSVSSPAILAINSLAESEALNVFKLYIHEASKCKNYEEYVRVARKYVYSDMIKKMDSAEVKSLPKEFKETIFSMVKNESFDVNDLVVNEENIEGNEATIKYSPKGHSNFKGTATLVRENNSWKIKEISEKISLQKKSAGKTVKPKQKKSAGTTAKPKQKLKLFTNASGMKFVLIPSGSFMMGSAVSVAETARHYKLSKQYFEEEHPRHKVSISKPFYLQTTEVTQEQWQKVMGNNPSHYKYRGKMRPVEKVSWHGAQDFIKRLNEIEGTDNYRLPTEAEWEYACRAGSDTKFSFGDEDQVLEEYAWHGYNSKGRTNPVGQKKPNAWGLYDMHGNVWEWCQDWYGPYPENHVSDPKGPLSGEARVCRGGSYAFDISHNRSAIRGKLHPKARGIFGDRGFRIAKDL